MHFSDRQNGFQKFVHAFTRDGAGWHDFDVTTPSTWSQTVLRHLGHDTIDVGAWQIALVGCNNDWNSSRFSVRNCFYSLWHDTVVCCDNQDRNVGDVSTSRSHFSKRFVARRIHKGDRATIFFHLIGSDLLSDATSFAGNNLGTDQIVEQRCLAMVDVAEKSNNGWSSNQIFKIIFDVIHFADQTGL